MIDGSGRAHNIPSLQEVESVLRSHIVQKRGGDVLQTYLPIVRLILGWQLKHKILERARSKTDSISLCRLLRVLNSTI